MTQPVTLYLRRKTTGGGTWFTHYFINKQRMNTFGAWLWQSLGLPDEDGKHELEVQVSLAEKMAWMQDA